MLKRVCVLLLAVIAVSLTGCAEMRQLRRQNEALTDQVNRYKDERATLLDNIEALEAQRESLQGRLADTQREAERMADVVAELRQEQSQLQRQRAELQKLVQGLSGISVETRREGNFIIVENEILFELGKADLTEAAMAALDDVAEYLAQKPDLRIRVDGHTDGVPITHSVWEDNYHLSAMRAHAVMGYLVDKGVDPGRMHIAGFGPNTPLVEPADPTEPVAENRRVEILVVPEGGRSIGEILEKFEQ
jgi:chemotaxis protein MotB